MKTHHLQVKINERVPSARIRHELYGGFTPYIKPINQWSHEVQRELEVTSCFNELARKHVKDLGVSWCVTNSNDMIFTFWSFERIGFRHTNGLPSKSGFTQDKSPATKGNGAIAMREICELADELQATLRLQAVNRTMAAYYERFGFQVTEVSVNLPCPYMVRMPNGN